MEAKVKGSVLLVGNFLSSSFGSRGVCEDLAEHLAAAGWSVVTTSARPCRLARLLDMTITAWRQRHRYDVAQVDVFSGPAFLWAEAVCWVLRRAKKPFVLTLHGGDLPAFARRWPGRVGCLLRSASKITTPSRYLLEQLQGYHDDIYLLPNPLDLSIYSPRVREHPQPRLMWLRAFHDIYNPSLAPKVVAILAVDFRNTQLTMVGPDKYDGSFQRTQEAAARLAVTERIALPGKVTKTEVPAWMNKGDIFLNTANMDNTPICVLEAMACGLCVVSTDVGGVPYLLEHEYDALLVPPDNPVAMATAVRRLLSEPGLADRLSRNARQKVEQFDWSLILPRWESLLGSLAEGNIA